MHYNRLLRAWVLDQCDCLLLSEILGSILASSLKAYLSEKKAMEWLKNSIIKKSKLVGQSDKFVSNSKKINIKNVYKAAFYHRAGQIEQFQADLEFSLAQQIKGLTERLACFLKERELKGVAGIFFKNGRLLLELILYACRIDITYSLLNKNEFILFSLGFQYPINYNYPTYRANHKRTRSNG